MEGVDLQDVYSGREATAVKHFILRHYLERLAYKVGSWSNTLNYVEGFAGPWKHRTQDYSDTSPHIAISELRRAKAGLAKIGRHPHIRCAFCESDPSAAAELTQSLARYEGIEAVVFPGPLLNHVEDILRFIQVPRVPEPRFTFLFLDPTGWTGFDPEAIAPILRIRNIEALINLMTKDIIRFVDSSDARTRRSFDPLFGSRAARVAWEGLVGRDREEAIVGAFRQRLQEIGGFKYAVDTVVLNPTSNRTYFHLVYATRNIEGLRAFRQVERESVPQQNKLREQARQRLRIERSGQGELFVPGEVEAVTDLQRLREECHDRALDAIVDLLQERKEIPYDDLEEAALLHRMVSERELKDWIAMLRAEGPIEVAGLGPRERTPKPGHGHRVVWRRG